jgi:hypothetical protein
MTTLGPYWVGDRPRDQVDVSLVLDANVTTLAGYDAATITLTGPDGLLVDTTGTTVTLGTNKVSIDWPGDRSLFTLPGWYSLQIALTGSGVVDHTAAMTFLVQALTGAPAWATPREVLTLTGVAVDHALVMQAQGVIELYAGTSYAATQPTNGGTGLGSRDKRLLRQAVAYQASFMAQQEALFSRAGMASVSQDGLAVSTGGDTDAWVLAPLAKAALKQVGWRGLDRSIRVGKGGRDGNLHQLESAWVRDEAGVTIWQPIGTPGRFPGLQDPHLPAGTTEYGV